MIERIVNLKNENAYGEKDLDLKKNRKMVTHLPIQSKVTT